jgi:hypothetical protein
MLRVIRITGRLVVILLIGGVLVGLALECSDNPFSDWVALRDLWRECDWQQILS